MVNVMKKILSILSMLTLVVSGCVNHGYVSETKILFDSPDYISESEKKDMVHKILSSFQDDFHKIKNNNNGNNALPLICVDRIENLALIEEGDKFTAQMTNYLSEILEKSGLFKTTNLANVALVQARIKELTEEFGYDESEVLKTFGNYRLPDYFISGTLRKVKNGKVYIYTLSLEFKDYRSMETYWSKTVEIRKE